MKVNQLGDFFRPEKYEIFLKLDDKNYKFRGKVAIFGEQVRDEIRLHAHNLEIFSAKIDSEIAQIKFLENEEIALEIPESAKSHAKIMQNSAPKKVELEFAGAISPTAMNGIYPAHYEIDGEKRAIFATQFESHFARRAFPCVDEPAAKAIFDVTIETAKNQVVLGNSEILSQEISGDRMTTKFLPTPKMSTYLLAFAVGDLQKFSTKTARGVAVNVFATPAQNPDSLRFAGEMAARLIDFYEEYFGVEYPLAKSDHLALPDFSAGAMENWGLITYRETALLVAPNASLESRESVANIIAHELAHQWFGNLVTMSWWNDLWLNESFASLMEYISVDALEPSWRTHDSFAAGGLIRALRRDSLHGVQAVQQDVATPDEISTLFDGAIVYSKGQRLLEMLKNFIGEENFRAGLKKYFAKFQYQNTTADDLWSCLSEASGENIAALMTPWLTQSGYPIVTARKSGDEIILTQEQFFADENSSSQKSAQLWPIPLFLPTQNRENAPIYSLKKSASKILMREKTLTISRDDFAGIFHLNQGNFAQFIADYDENLRAEIFENFAQFDRADRMKFLTEALLLAAGGRIFASDLVDYLRRAPSETDYAVWDIFWNMFAKLKNLAGDDEKILANLRRLIREIIASKMAEFQENWPDNFSENARKSWSDNALKIQKTIFALEIFAEEKTPRAETILAKRLFEVYRENENNLAKIDGNLRQLILKTAVLRGDDTIFAKMWQQYARENDADLAGEIAAALAASQNQAQIAQNLANLTDGEKVRLQDVFYWFSYLMANRFSRHSAWNWLRQNWSWIEESFAADASYDTFPRVCGAYLNSEQDLHEFREFFAPLRENLVLKRSILLAENQITANINFVQQNREKLAQKLTEIL